MESYMDRGIETDREGERDWVEKVRENQRKWGKEGGRNWGGRRE